MRVHAGLGLALGLALVACTNDYEDFAFSEDGGAGSSAAAGSGGSAAGGSGGAAGVGGSAGAATGGAAGAGTGGVGTGGAGTGGAGTGGAGTGGAGTGGVGTGGAGTGGAGTGGAGTGGAGTGGAGTGGAGTGGATGNLPGVVSCEGENDCSLSTSFCCASQGGANCVPDGSPCTPGTDVFCDGPEDCAANEVCCGQLFGGNFYSTLQCRAGNQCNENQGRRVFCGTTPNACTGGQTCQASSILPQYNYCQGN